MPNISEKNFEATIEASLTKDIVKSGDGSAAASHPIGSFEGQPGGYQKRNDADYDRSLCLIPNDALDFVYATQAKEWDKFKKLIGPEAKSRFLNRLASEVRDRGTLDVLRQGIKSDGSLFRLAYFRPSSGLNEELRNLYQANVFTVIRHLHFSETCEKSLDLALFLNGLPLFTAELKNPLMAQNVMDAVRQYRQDRDPKEPLFAFGRCLAHFAVDPDLVYLTTKLQGLKTVFIPFNQGRDNGAGNPPSWKGFATSYLWEQTWSRDSVLDLIRHFIHIVEDEDDKGKKTGGKTLLFPRYHQLEAVRGLVKQAYAAGAGQRYLIQHSAGSGKSNSIAWLAHQLSVLHDDEDKRVFDSIIVITDRRVLDRQLQRTVRQFEQTSGVVENIDTTSKQLKQALEEGKTIIVTTLQKFPVIADDMRSLAGKRFAVIVDEAHSSQTGESTKSLKSVLAATSLEEAVKEEADAEEYDEEDRIVEAMKERGRLPNVSYFAFTATPKPKTMELFGEKQADGRFVPFSLYSMRQAIEEGFILDVLKNYTTYKTYWNLLKKVAEDPKYDRQKASYLLKSFVDLHEHAVAKKVAIMIDHFMGQVMARIGGRAKAMIVTRSRLHAVKYKLAIDEHLKAKGSPFKALVAFSGTVKDGGRDYTEAAMNGLPEAQTAETFKASDYLILIVAFKFQTGFDQPLLHTMYVDKKLGGVNAVQTLSRLNRTHPGKDETFVLDFANEADDIKKAFEPYYDRTLLAEATDPNILYDLETKLRAAHFYTAEDVKSFASVYFDPKGTQDKLHAVLQAPVDRYLAATEDDRVAFRGHLQDFVNLYAFLSQILSFTDADLERLYVFGRLLLRKLPVSRARLPVEVQLQIDIESFRVQRTGSGSISLPRGTSVLQPQQIKPTVVPPVDEIEPLSKIIEELNERFGTDFTKEDRVFIEQLEAKLSANEALDNAIKVNTPDNARLTFDHVVNDKLQEMIDTNFKFYKRVTDDSLFAKTFVDWLFERYLRKTK